MINKDGGGTIFRFYGGDTAVMRGDIGLLGGPPTRENPALNLMGNSQTGVWRGVEMWVCGLSVKM